MATLQLAAVALCTVARIAEPESLQALQALAPQTRQDRLVVGADAKFAVAWEAAQKDWEDVGNPLHSKDRDHRFAQLAAAIETIAQS